MARRHRVDTAPPVARERAARRIGANRTIVLGRKSDPKTPGNLRFAGERRPSGSRCKHLATPGRRRRRHLQNGGGTRQQLPLHPGAARQWEGTYGSQAICDLLERGQRVAVTSNSHKAIHNLLRKVEEGVSQRGGSFHGRYKHNKSNPDSEYRNSLFIASYDSNESFYGDEYSLAGGTGWLFAREELAGSSTTSSSTKPGKWRSPTLSLFCVREERRVVGRPGTACAGRPGAAAASRRRFGSGTLAGRGAHGGAASRHLSGRFVSDAARNRGFISDAVYDKRLRAADSTRAHRISVGTTELAGLYYVEVEHAGNSSHSEEEADEIVAQVSRFASEAWWSIQSRPSAAGSSAP